MGDIYIYICINAEGLGLKCRESFALLEGFRLLQGHGLRDWVWALGFRVPLGLRDKGP